MRRLLITCLWALQFTAIGATYEERAVASVLMGEAWSDGVPGMVAVGEVIHQRMLDKREAPLQIISAHHGRVHAFSCLNGTTMDRLIEKFTTKPQFQTALQLASIVCQAPGRLPGLANAATHYTRVDERPYWAKGMRPVAIIGNHAFYRLKHY